MSRSIIIEAITDPFQILQTIHKNKKKYEIVKNDHFKDCTFKPTVLKTSRTMAEKKFT